VSKCFLDTNILVYTADHDNKKKQKQARHFLKTITQKSEITISTQVLQEFYITATKKLGIEPLVVKKLTHVWEIFEVVNVTPTIIKDAIDCSILQKISFWDALIIISAEYAKCEVLFSEDLNHGQIINGVRIENPFLSKTK